MDRQARAVVVGGGNVGASVLYHLCREGWTDTILVEKAELTSGATWHAAGLVSRMTGSHTMGKISDYAVDLYKTIETETGQAVSWHNCGSLRIAASEAHRDWLMHTRDAVIARGQECHWLSPAELKSHNPLIDLDGIIGGIFTPDDGHVDPSGTCNAMAKGARDMGGVILRRNRVVDIRPTGTGEWDVVTENGTIRCEHVINAGGYHARQIGEFSGLDLPIVPMQHHYIVTDKVPEFAALDAEIPVTRDDHFTGYLRQEQGGALIGLYDTHDALPKWADGCPWESESELFEPDFDRITPWLEKCFARFPSLTEIGIKQIVNGAITYTPDGSPLTGPAPGLKNYWLACGVTVGISWGPGLGKYLAQWIVHGTAEVSMRGLDPRRFGPWADRDYVMARCREDYMVRLSLPFPQDQREVSRNIRTSGVYEQTKALGAIFEDAGAWERPRLYAPEAWQGTEPRTWRRGGSHDIAMAEVHAIRQSVGLGDFSAFSKFEINGPQSEAWLNRLCANRIPQQIGGTCLTLLLNEQGTIEGEATVAKLDENRYWFVTGGPSERRVWDWMTLHQRGTEEIAITNLSDDYGMLTLAGPRARTVLQSLSEDDLSHAVFGWLKAREITVAGVAVIALRMSFTGELAWELHARQEDLATLWDALMAAGAPYAIKPFGSKAVEMMRMEKAYRGGHELANDATPLHTDQMRFVKKDLPFIGQAGLANLSRTGPSSVIVYLAMDSGDVDPSGGEAVFSDGRLVGSISSGSMSPATGKSLAFAYIDPALSAPGTELEISIMGTLRPATILAEPVYDPKNEMIKSAAN